MEMTATMARRFVYDRMTGEEFRTAMDQALVPQKAFARIFGVDPRVTERWYKGEQDIPVWVPIALALMSEPAGIAIARREAAEWIKTDNERPDLGDYPFKTQRGDDDDTF